MICQRRGGQGAVSDWEEGRCRKLIQITIHLHSQARLSQICSVCRICIPNPIDPNAIVLDPIVARPHNDQGSQSP